MVQGDNTAPATKGDLKALQEDLQQFKADVMLHFDTAVELIRHDLIGANHDEIAVLQDARTDHEQRITTVEQVVGLRS